MATKKTRPRKNAKAANQNPGGSKNVGTKMLDAYTITSNFGVGMLSNGEYTRPGEPKKARPAKKRTKR